MHVGGGVSVGVGHVGECACDGYCAGLLGDGDCVVLLCGGIVVSGDVQSIFGGVLSGVEVLCHSCILTTITIIITIGIECVMDGMVLVEDAVHFSCDIWGS